MSKFITLSHAAGDLALANLPVLCLDTCEFIDVVRGVAEGSLTQIQLFRNIQEDQVVGLRSIRVVVTYLVRHEWQQNKHDAVSRVDSFLNDLSARMERVGSARGLVRLSEPRRNQNLVDPILTRTLRDLAESILDHAVWLEKHEPCVIRALQRVMDHRRPSHKNEIKDSINWEHYLELSSQLKVLGHTEDRIFVSANKNDFWADGLGTDRKRPLIHKDLEVEAEAAGLQFFGKLDQALRKMGVLK